MPALTLSDAHAQHLIRAALARHRDADRAPADDDGLATWLEDHGEPVAAAAVRWLSGHLTSYPPGSP